MKCPKCKSGEIIGRAKLLINVYIDETGEGDHYEDAYCGHEMDCYFCVSCGYESNRWPVFDTREKVIEV